MSMFFSGFCAALAVDAISEREWKFALAFFFLGFVLFVA